MADVQPLGIVPTTSMCTPSTQGAAKAAPTPLWIPFQQPEPFAHVRLAGEPVTAVATEGEEYRKVKLRPCTEDFDAV